MMQPATATERIKYLTEKQKALLNEARELNNQSRELLAEAQLLWEIVEDLQNNKIDPDDPADPSIFIP